MVRYVKLAQLASASVKIIFETVSEWRQEATPCASSYHRPMNPEPRTCSAATSPGGRAVSFLLGVFAIFFGGNERL